MSLLPKLLLLILFIVSVRSAIYIGSCQDPDDWNLQNINWSQLRTSKANRIHIINDIGANNISARYYSVINRDRQAHNGLTNAYIFTLDMSSNEIQFIEPGSFLYIKECLYHLNLTQNHIKVLHNGSLNHLESLRELNLTWNEMEVIEDDVFYGCPELEVLDLSYNLLKNILKGSLSGLNKLKILYVTDNEISYIDKDMSGTLVSLVQLHLERNNLKRISSGMFATIPSLYMLRLDNNGINQIDLGAFRGLRQLHELYLGDNNLPDFEFGQFSGLSDLRYLNVSYNNLERANENILFTRSLLDTLILDGNRIRKLNVKSIARRLKNLKRISIGGLPFECTDLFRILTEFNDRNIDVVEVYARADDYVSNIKGIQCERSDESVGVSSRFGEAQLDDALDSAAMTEMEPPMNPALLDIKTLMLINVILLLIVIAIIIIGFVCARWLHKVAPVPPKSKL